MSPKSMEYYAAAVMVTASHSTFQWSDDCRVESLGSASSAVRHGCIKRAEQRRWRSNVLEGTSEALASATSPTMSVCLERPLTA